MKAAKQAEILALFRLHRYRCTRAGRVYGPRGVSLRSSTNNRGYPLVTLLGRRRITVAVHQAVFLFFNGPYDPQKQINHLDGVKTNNRPENLALVTPSENQNHAHMLGLHNQRGENNGYAKLTWELVRAVREEFAAGESQAEIHRKFGISRSQVHNIVMEKTWYETART